MIQYVEGRMMFGQELTGWLDKDRPLLPCLDFAGRIDYFEKRVRLVSINPISRLLGPLRATEIDNDESSVLLIAGVAICCSIEAMGKFVNGGRGRNKDRFDAFLLRYMSTSFKDAYIGDESYGAILWKYFRNGIAHGFAVCHGGFDENGGEYFAENEIVGRPCLLINPYKLLTDFKGGFERYLGELRSALPDHQSLRDNFDKSFKEVFVEGR